MTPNQNLQNSITVARRPPDVEDYIDMIRRYRSWILGPLFAGLVISVVASFLWPDTYISTATMRITPQQIPERLVPSNVSMQIGERLSQMQQDILSRQSLTELIQRPLLDLYKKERNRKPMEDVIEEMKKDVQIRIIEAPSAARRYASAFRIAFSYTDRYKAQAVVQYLVTRFMEQNVNVLRLQSATTTGFLNDELNVAKTNLDKLEQEITKFRMENAGKLPEQLNSNLQTLNALQTQLGSVSEALNRNAQEKMVLETQLQNLKNQSSLISSGAEQTVSSTAVKNERLIQLNRTIMDFRTTLSALRETYKEDYPDIREMRARLAVLEKERDTLELDEQQNSGKVKTTKVTNPVALRSLEDAKAAIASTQALIQAKVSDMQERTRQQADIQRQIQLYQARVEASPMNEQRYTVMTRDYQLAKEKYSEMARIKSLSQTASNLEDRKAGENLEVLDSPSLPEAPAKPNRPVIAALGTAMGLVLGIFLAGAREMKDSSLKNLKDVRAYTNLPVLTSIPLLENALLLRRKRRLFWLAWSSAIILGTIAMSGSMYYYYFGRG